MLLKLRVNDIEASKVLELIENKKAVCGYFLSIKCLGTIIDQTLTFNENSDSIFK